MIIYYRLALYAFFGVLPSLVWLFYYLGKDLHPEPKRMILEIFLLGSLVTVPVFIIQVSLAQLLAQAEYAGFFGGWPVAQQVLKWFVIIALTEEVLKYLVVKVSVMKTYALDEPLDIMLYMVVAALGFSAIENILYLSSPLLPASPDAISFTVMLKTTVLVAFIRFVGATFLHTLCAALVGYFLALASIRSKKGLSLTLLGLLLATVLHGLYDFSIMTLQAPFNFLIPAGIITGLAIFMIWDFNEVKKIKGICKLN